VNDVTCSGCHQTPRHRRLIPRRRLDAAKPSKFDRGRRPRRISWRPRSPVATFWASLNRGSSPDYSRGFSQRRNCARPPELAENCREPNITTAGARHCYQPERKVRRQRPEFPRLELRQGAGLDGWPARLAHRHCAFVQKPAVILRILPDLGQTDRELLFGFHPQHNYATGTENMDE